MSQLVGLIVREAAGALTKLLRMDFGKTFNLDNGRTGHIEYKIVILLIDNVRELTEIRINFLCLNDMF
jgi:hypothetical protein